VRIKIKEVILLCVVLLCSFKSTASGKWVLNGAADYKELNMTLYIGGLYLEAPSEDVAYIFDPSTAKKMRIIIGDKPWSKRAWAEHWRNRMAINPNNADVGASEQSDLANFTSFLRGNLAEGDEITLSYSEGQTRVSLNGEGVLSSKSSYVIDSVLMTWLAEIPPSSIFKKSLLSGAASGAWAVDRGLLDSHSVPASRRALFSSWVKTENERRAESQRLQQEARKKAEQQKALLAKKKQEAEAKRKLAAAQKRSKAEKARLAKLHKLQQDKLKKEEQAYYQALVQWQFQRYVDRHFIKYEQESKEIAKTNTSFRMGFTFERNRKASDFASTDQKLNRQPIKVAMQQVIDSAAHHITIPAGLEGDLWALQVKHRIFDVNELGNELAPPVRPPHLLSGGGDGNGSGNDSRQAISEYKAYLKEEVRWAVSKLEDGLTGRRENKLKLKLTVDQWGDVKEVKFLRRPRYPYSSDYIRQLLAKRSPYRILTLESDLQEVSIEVDSREQ